MAGLFFNNGKAGTIEPHNLFKLVYIFLLMCKYCSIESWQVTFLRCHDTLFVWRLGHLRCSCSQIASRHHMVFDRIQRFDNIIDPFFHVFCIVFHQALMSLVIAMQRWANRIRAGPACWRLCRARTHIACTWCCSTRPSACSSSTMCRRRSSCKCSPRSCVGWPSRPWLCSPSRRYSPTKCSPSRALST